MAYVRLQRFVSGNGAGVGVGTTSEFTYSGSNGAIVLSIELIWSPRVYYNAGTQNESIRYGDIHAYVADASTSRSFIDVTGTAENQKLIVVPTNGRWSWVHPKKFEILAASDVISKLGTRNLGAYPTGVITGSLRVIAGYDPITAVSHNLMIETELLVFDTNLL